MGSIRVWKLFAVVALIVASVGTAHAASFIVQPDEAASKDVFLYEFNVGGFFGIPTPPRTTNLDTETLDMISPPPVPFGNFLGAAKTDPFSLTPGGPLREHGTRTLIQFDLGSIPLTGKQVGGAWINLWALPALPAFESPNAANPVTTDLRRVTSAWGEQAATWENDPDTEGAPSATIMQDSVNVWVRFDVTSLVRDWLDNPSTNLGVELSQRDVVELAVPGARDRYFASLYASSAFADATKRPYLEVASVPEPASLALLATGLALVRFTARRRRSI